MQKSLNYARKNHNPLLRWHNYIQVYSGHASLVLGFLLLFAAQGLERRLDDTVEDKRGVDKEGKSHNLQEFEALPAETQRYNPDEKCAASINGRSRGGTHASGDGEAKEVKPAIIM